MANILRFPRGNDVVVCKKEDILATIDDNILDKELAYALIEELEITADKFLSEGKWVGIPFLGNIRKNKYREKLHSKETKELIDSAKTTLDKSEYVLFRRQIGNEISESIRRERVINYATSRFVTKNRPFYRYVRKIYGEVGAKFLCSTLIAMEFANQDELFNGQQ